MFQLKFEVAGDVQLNRAFSRFTEDVKDFSEPLQEMVDDFHKVIEPKQFSSEGSRGSHGWARLSTDYGAWKAKNYPGRKILVLTGLMQESLFGENPWAIEEVKPLEMTVGTKLPFALYHQQGTTKMPARPVIDLTESDKTRWTKFVQAYVVKQANREFADLMPTVGAGQMHVKSI